jgi:hypothetical protein
MNDAHDNAATDREMLARFESKKDGASNEDQTEPVVTDSPTEIQETLLDAVLKNQSPTIVHVVYCDHVDPKIMDNARYWHNAVPRMRDVAEEIQALLDKTDKKPVDWSAAEFRAELVKVRDAITLEFG